LLVGERDEGVVVLAGNDEEIRHAAGIMRTRPGMSSEMDSFSWIKKPVG
jgi:hypothetical protein